MHRRLIFILFVVPGINFIVSAQPPKYAPKHFVVYKDTVEFKAILPPKNGPARVYLELPAMEIWDVDDNNTTMIRGGANALVCIEGNYKNGNRNDVFKAYLIDSLDHSKHYKIWEQTYVNDKLNGEWRTYYLNGTLAKVTNFKDDSLHGIYRQYWIDGKRIQEEKEYFNGRNSFIQRTYFNSGKLEKEATVKNRILNGAAKSYYENGQLKETIQFINDLPQGPSKRYYDNGNLMEEANFADGEFHGERKYYHPNGKIWSINEYKNGKYWTAIANYSDKGVKRPQGTLKNGTGTLIFYDEDGAVRETLNIVDGIQR
jgi:antitoxin component YwqK of YwqJK toxin-antitoxin module